MKKSHKIAIIIAVIVIIGAGIITYYSLSNYAWYGNGGHVEWIKYSEIPVLFGENVLYLNKDYFASIGLEDDFTLDVGFSGRSKTIYNKTVSGYDPKAISYYYCHKINAIVSNDVSFTDLFIDYSKEDYKPSVELEEIDYNALKYSIVSNEDNNVLYIRKDNSYLVIRFQATAHLSEDDFKTYCLNNIFPYIG